MCLWAVLLAAWLPPEMLSLTCDKYISFKAKHSHKTLFNKAVHPVTACFLLFVLMVMPQSLGQDPVCVLKEHRIIES